MKQGLFILVLFFCCTLATAQELLEKKIYFSSSEQTLEQTLLNLSQQTGINISFSTQILNQDELISIDVKKKNIKSILHQLLRGTKLEFDVLKDEILILSKSLKKYTISGTIEDLSSGESLIGANLLIQANMKGTSSNEYGFYSITLTEGATNLVFSYLGFEKKVIKLNLQMDTTLNVKMISNLTFPEVVVTDVKENPLFLFKEISTNILDPKEIKKVPALGGIPDVMRASHLLAGVQSGGDGLGGLFVRGGNTDQNLVLLDGVPVYNPTHFVGLLSIFNTRAIRSAELIKGGFPARFGGRLSSVLDVRIKEGNRNKLSGDASLGLIATSASLEGPFANGKGAFFISGRRSIPDLLIKPLTKRIQINNGVEGFLNYYFYDLNAKANYSLSKKDKIYVSFYGGGDRFENPKESIEITDDITIEEKDNQFLDWGKTIGSIRNNRIWGNKLFSNLTFNFSKYQFATEEFSGSRRSVDTLQSEEFDFGKYNTTIEDWSAKLDFDYFPNSTTRVKIGISGIRHEFRPRVISINEDNLLGIGYDIGEDIDSLIVTSPINSVEIDAYFEGETQHTDRIKSNLGIHFASFITGEKNYVSVQPRIAFNIQLRKKWYLNTSFSVSSQFLHLLTRSGIGLPTDLWVPSTKRIKPQGSWIAVAGLGYEGTKGFSISLETYYKQLSNILTYREGTIFSVIDARNWEDNVDIGDGEAYGIELALKKETRKTTAWLNYTYSFATREFKDVNQGNPYPFRYDRRHFLKAGVTHKINSKFAISMDYVYGTGNAITIATRIFEYYSPFSEEPSIAQIFGEKNSFRIPPYHRLDLGISFSKPHKWGAEEFSFGVYNAYGRLNPLFISLKDNPTISGTKQFFQTSLLSFVPYVTYVVSF